MKSIIFQIAILILTGWMKYRRQLHSRTSHNCMGEIDATFLFRSSVRPSVRPSVCVCVWVHWNKNKKCWRKIYDRCRLIRKFWIVNNACATIVNDKTIEYAAHSCVMFSCVCHVFLLIYVVMDFNFFLGIKIFDQKNVERLRSKMNILKYNSFELCHHHHNLSLWIYQKLTHN